MLTKLHGRRRIVIFCAAFAVVGAVIILSGRAATNTTAYEAESGALGGITTTGSDSLASGGRYVRFAAPVAGGGFITRSGTNLMLAGNVFQFVGFNAYGMTGCRTGAAWTTQQLDTYFSKLPPHSLTRTWAFEYYGTGAIQTILTEAAKYNQRVILVLGDGNSACNDTDYAPDGDGSGKTLAFYQNGWKNSYSAWVRDIVPQFKNNPTVAFWEILNEPGNYGSSPDNATMKAFLDGSAALIKSLDPNHLVGTGANYSGNAGFSDYQSAHSGPNIDLVSFHEYAWEYEGRVVVSGHFNEAKTAALALNKPYYAGEAGAPSGSNCLSLNLSARANYLKQKADAYISGGAAGINFWDYEPATNISGCDHDINANDPLVTIVQNYSLP